MNSRTIHNPVSGEQATWVETSSENGGVRTVADFEVKAGGGVRMHQHTDHEERIEVVEGEIEVVMGGKTFTLRAGEHCLIPRGTPHTWRNPAGAAKLRFRGTMTPGHPGFERFLRVWFGLGRDGGLRRNGIPRRMGDMALLAEWDPSILAGVLRLVAPLFRWSARRAHATGRAKDLLQRYDAA